MEELIQSIYHITKDYKSGDSQDLEAGMSALRIRRWVQQFRENERMPILTEMEHILKTRYCSKRKVWNFLDRVVSKLSADLGFLSPKDFLANTQVLDLQEKGKSQKVMLHIFDQVIQANYGVSLEYCGSRSKKISLYLDDVLCTGLTLVRNLKQWAENPFNNDATNKEAVINGRTILICSYVFVHHKNFNKKVYELRRKVAEEFPDNMKLYRLVPIDNSIELGSKVQFIIPENCGQPASVIEYRNAIKNQVDQRADEKKWQRNPDDFFRPSNVPLTEEFFTSKANRVILENAFLRKGIEILNNGRSRINNMRALGYSLPSQKDFGFGALCFTWRNVPNNTPLVFWYSGGTDFFPLFQVTRKGIGFRAPRINEVRGDNHSAMDNEVDDLPF